MKVVVDADRCEGHAKCQASAPDVFQVGDDDISRVIVDEVPEALVADVEQAIRICPRQAISWADSPGQAGN